MDTIILVPGGGGSRLELNGQEIWPPNVLEFAGHYGRIAELQDRAVEPTTVVDWYYLIPQPPLIPFYAVYQPLQNDLNAIAQQMGRGRVDFPYDWRLDVREFGGQSG